MRRVKTAALAVSVSIGVAAAACSSEKSSQQSSSALAPSDSASGPTIPNVPPSDLPPGDQHIDFGKLKAEKSKAKPVVMAKQMAHLAARYDLSDKPSPNVRMDRSKPVQSGVRVKLPAGVLSFDDLCGMSPEEIRAKNLFPLGFLPLPHPNHMEGGMVFPLSTIDEIKKQTLRDLARFDLDFDLPEHFLAEFPPAIYLTTRPDLGDVSQGKLVTIDNYYELFKGILNPKQLDGFRLLLTPTPQQQFNNIDDRRSDRPSLGVACLDCHINGGTNAATHLVGDIRPQALRRRVDTPALRGVRIQRLFGSQRALRSIEDFTEFEQRAAYFDGDQVAAHKKGVSFLDRGGQVHHMAELQELFDFPPAPKLGLDGKLAPSKATPAELRGQEVFFGKGRCASCHEPPFYTDNDMHDLEVERFYPPQDVNGRFATNSEGPTKTFPLRGIKNTPPYLHDGRLLTLEDSVEFFNLVLGTRLTAEEKSDLLAFLYTL
jgi:cytochrome c peroxidase